MVHPTNESPALNSYEANTVQQVLVTLLYYARAFDPKMIIALNKIADKQSKSTKKNSENVGQLLNYVAIHSGTLTRYHSSIMTLHMHCDTSFLLVPGANIRAGGHH